MKRCCKYVTSPAEASGTGCDTSGTDEVQYPHLSTRILKLNLPRHEPAYVGRAAPWPAALAQRQQQGFGLLSKVGSCLHSSLSPPVTAPLVSYIHKLTACRTCKAHRRHRAYAAQDGGATSCRVMAQSSLNELPHHDELFCAALCYCFLCGRPMRACSPSAEQCVPMTAHRWSRCVPFHAAAFYQACKACAVL